jgi:hypothetical protein
MRRIKSLLFGISTLALMSGAAFAGQDSTVHGSVETSPPELLASENFGSESVGPNSYGAIDNSAALERDDAYSAPVTEELALQEGDVIYVYPMEVTEVWVIPSESSEMPG